MGKPGTLVLFDIDGTLIDTGGAGLKALEAGFFEAFPELAGAAFPELDLGGATDGGLIQRLFPAFGIEISDSSQERFFQAYLNALDQDLSTFKALGKARLLPGASALVARLGEEPNRYYQGLLTGNLERGARIKLAQFGLSEALLPGAFGDDHSDRNRLGPIALERAETYFGRAFDRDSVFIIGDTVKDIACARAAGFRVIAVATGASRKESLALENPDGLVDDLHDIESVLALMQ
ncbi:MAG: HAD family hydrolase [Verrucomicrobiota bacterium]